MQVDDQQQPEDLQATITALDQSIAHQVQLREQLKRRAEEQKRERRTAAMHRAESLGWKGVINGGAIAAGIAWLTRQARRARDRTVIAGVVVGAVGGITATAAIAAQLDGSSEPIREQARARPPITSPAPMRATRPPPTRPTPAPAPRPTDVRPRQAPPTTIVIRTAPPRVVTRTPGAKPSTRTPIVRPPTTTPVTPPATTEIDDDHALCELVGLLCGQLIR